MPIQIAVCIGACGRRCDSGLKHFLIAGTPTRLSFGALCCQAGFTSTQGDLVDDIISLVAITLINHECCYRIKRE
jgi:hypothetical protein